MIGCDDEGRMRGTAMLLRDSKTHTRSPPRDKTNNHNNTINTINTINTTSAGQTRQEVPESMMEGAPRFFCAVLLNCSSSTAVECESPNLSDVAPTMKSSVASAGVYHIVPAAVCARARLRALTSVAR